MIEPEIFQKPYVAFRHVPYVCEDGSNATSVDGGF